MNCLTDYIGYKGCSDGTPGSGLLVNSLPGLPSELLTKAANADQVTAKNVWADVQLTAQAQLLSDVATAFSDRYKIRSIAQTINMGEGLSVDQSNAFAGFRGFRIDPKNVLTGVEGYVRSNLMGMSVDSVRFFLRVNNLTANFNLRVYNLETNTQVFESVIDYTQMSVGWNTLPINSVFELSPHGFVIGYNEIESFMLPVSDQLNAHFSSCLCTCLNCDGCVGTISGASTVDGITWTYPDDSYGMTASISMVCSYEGIICNNKKTFARSMWYLTGHHLMQHAIYTPSFSRYNTIDKEKSKELMDYFFQMYETELNRVIKGIELNLGDVCLSCDAPITNVYSIP